MRVYYWKFFVRFLIALTVFCVATFLFLLGWWPLAAAVLIGGGWYVYLFPDSVSDRRYDAHFATPQELRSLTNNPMQGNGVMIGYAYKELLTVRPGTAGKNEIGHFMWVGPNRSGKGLSITSNLLQWEGSAIVTDIKGEIFEATAAYRRDVLGQRIVVLNPSSEERSHRFDPFLEMETDEQIFSAASAFMNPDSDGENAVFAQRASSVLAAMIRAAKLKGWPIIPTLDAFLYHPQGLAGATLILHSLNDPMVSKWVNAFLGKDPDQMDWEAADGDRFLKNSWQRLVTAAQYLTTAGVLYMTSGSDVRAEDLMKEKVTVYLIFRESELETTLPLYNLVVDSIFKTIRRKYDMQKKHYDKNGVRTLAVFDEAYVACPNQLPDYSSTVSGRGISMAIYVQSLAQLGDVWGKGGKTTLMENVHTKIFLPAVDRSDTDREGTAAFVAGSCGEYMVEDRGVSKQEHEHELSSNVRLTTRELITTSEFGQLKQGQSIVISNELPPIFAYRLEPWRFKAFQQAQNLAAPELPEKSDVSLQKVTLPPVPRPGKAAKPGKVATDRSVLEQPTIPKL